MMQHMKKISDQASVSACAEGRQNGSVRRTWRGGGGGAKCLGACRRMDLPGRGMHTEIVKRSERQVGDQSQKKLLRRVDSL